MNGVNGMRLDQILEQFSEKNGIDYTVCGNIEVEIDGLNLCNRESVNNSIMSYAVNDSYVEAVVNKQYIKCLILRQEDKKSYDKIISNREGAIILSNKPEGLFYKLHEFLYAHTNFYEKYEFESQIGKNCKIAKSAIIEAGVIIGDNVTIGANTVVKHGSVLDDDVTIGCNSTIGSEGFQLIIDDELPSIHVTHAGKCHLCRNVYVGDNSCVCNSLFEGETYIGENVKIDNLVHVAHNLYIGNNAVVTAHVIICGSARIEEGAWIAPNASILNRVVIGAHALVGMGSVVLKNVSPHTIVYGNPAVEHSRS